MKRALVAFAFLATSACLNSLTSVGSPCSTDTDCEGGHHCDTSSPGGFCSRGCTYEGAADECPSGSLCTYTGGTVMVCAPDCKTDSDCRSQYGCYPVKNSTKLACGPKRS